MLYKTIGTDSLIKVTELSKKGMDKAAKNEVAELRKIAEITQTPANNDPISLEVDSEGKIGTPASSAAPTPSAASTPSADDEKTT